jgi:neuropeptide Y receptor
MNLHLRRYSEWEEMLYTTLYVIISLFALVGNGVVILAVIRKKEMRTNRNVLIVNLALSNLMLALTTIPFLWLPSIEFEFPYSKFFCKFANALPGSNIYCSTLTISVIAIDRYYSVTQMNVTTTGRSECLRAVFISLFIWVFSFLLSFPLLVYYDTTMLYVFNDVIVYDSERNETRMRSYGWRQCRLSPGVKSDDDRSEVANVESHTRTIQLAMSLMQVFFLYLVPLVVLSIFNVKLSRFLKLNAKHINRSKSGPRRESYALSSGVIVCDDNDTLPSSRRCSAAHWTETNAERASERRRSRTTALLVAMAGSYAVLWFPFTVVSVLIDADLLYIENGAAIIERIDQSCKLLSILSICVNPFLYGFLNTNFRHEFTDIFNTWIRCLPNKTQLRHSTNYASISPRRPSEQEQRSGPFSLFRKNCTVCSQNDRRTSAADSCTRSKCGTRGSSFDANASVQMECTVRSTGSTMLLTVPDTQ